MADTKIIVNKHYRRPSDINQSVFSNQKKINKYGLGEDEYLREGEIVICNNKDNPGLYIMTESASTENPGKVINITSAENIKLSSGYTESPETGAALELASGDTIDEAFGKVSKQVKEALENAMPNVGDGLKVDTAGDGTKTLKADIDNYTILSDNGTLKINPSIIGGGGGSSVIYTPGEYISIDPVNNSINVTGITPDDYATKQELSDEAASIMNDVVEAIADSEEHVTSALTSYIDAQGFANGEEVDRKIEEASTAITEVESTLRSEIDNVSAETQNQISSAILESKGYTDNKVTELSNRITGELNEFEQDFEESQAVITSAITELQEEVRNIDPSAIELKGTTITSCTESFIGLDGQMHEPGVYMILEFGKPDGESTYSYSDVSELFSRGSVYLTESEYEELLENEQVDPNVTYYTYEDEA